MLNDKHTIAIVGAGSWGTAIALHLANAGHTIYLWSHNHKDIALMQKEHVNVRYLPEYKFPELIVPSDDLKQSIENSDYVIIAVPSHAFKSILDQMPRPKGGISWLTKGIDPDTHGLLSTLVAEKYGLSYPVAVLSGPSFAKEVAQLLPTAVTLAANNLDYQTQIHQIFHHENLRVYLSDDLTGVQICGAVKNVLAIACGISDGMGFGANAKAALITRGLAEMSRLGIAMGAAQDTFSGLAGVGDLVLTCTDNQSRNRRFGLLVGQGTSIKDAEKQIGQVVEGKHNAAQVCALAEEYGIEMPICEQINNLLLNKCNPEEVLNHLMSRPARKEIE